MSQPIRILHVIGRMDRGGAETFLMNLYRCIDRNRVQFDFVENCLREASYDEEIRSLGGRIYRCPHYNGRNHFSYCSWWDTFFKTHGAEYTAVHGHLGSTAAIYLGIAKKHGCFTIAHSHGVLGFGLHDLLYRVYSHPVRWIADQFFACSCKAGISRYGRGVTSDPHRYRTLPCAVETSKFAFRPDERYCLRRELGINEKLVIGHVGRFVPEKNHAFLLRVFSAFQHQNPDSVLLLVGDGPLRGSIEKQVHSMGINDSVIFAGVQDNPSAWYQAMDIFLFPSLREGFGMAPLEAQISGLPCILSDTVPDDCIATELVTKYSLHNSPEDWAKQILFLASLPRRDHSRQVSELGYDINRTAKWLEAFYLKTGEQNNDCAFPSHHPNSNL